MHHPKSKTDSSKTSLFDLNLPGVTPEDAPLPHPEPSYEAQLAHAVLLVKSAPPDLFERRRASMNPEPFRL
jgi:hypothetical protein